MLGSQWSLSPSGHAGVLPQVELPPRQEQARHSAPEEEERQEDICFNLFAFVNTLVANYNWMI